MPALNGHWSALLLFALAFLFIGWIVSIVSAVFTYSNFEVNLHDGKLRRHYGLINQIESVVPLPRIQVMRTSESLFQRWLKLCKLYVETAGSFEKQDLGGSALLSPLIESDRIAGLARLILPNRAIQDVSWKRVSPHTIRIFAQKAFMVYAVLVAGSAVYFGPRAFWALMPLAVWSVISGWLHYKTTGYDEKDNLLAVCHG